jgi:hypothetical protein
MILRQDQVDKLTREHMNWLKPELFRILNQRLKDGGAILPTQEEARKLLGNFAGDIRMLESLKNLTEEQINTFQCILYGLEFLLVLAISREQE